jgi:hypothetical protein
MERSASLRHEESKEIQLQSMKKSEMAAQQIQDQVSYNLIAGLIYSVVDLFFSDISINSRTDLVCSGTASQDPGRCSEQDHG